MSRVCLFMRKLRPIARSKHHLTILHTTKWTIKCKLRIFLSALNMPTERPSCLPPVLPLWPIIPALFRTRGASPSLDIARHSDSPLTRTRHRGVTCRQPQRRLFPAFLWFSAPPPARLQTKLAGLPKPPSLSSKPKEHSQIYWALPAYIQNLVAAERCQ